MYFASDNAGPAHPQVMQAMLDVNAGYAPAYGVEPLMDEVRTRIREIFEAPEAAVYLVATGTAANCLALATMAQPWQTIFASRFSHIHEDECNGPEFYTGGAKLTLVGTDDKMTAETLDAALRYEETRGVHGPQRGPVSITQVTERGRVHDLKELSALCDMAHSHAQPVHMDGARFANALVTLGCTPAEMTWKLGINALSFGGTKNGAPGVEAVVFFDPEQAWEFELRRKRGAHLFSKHRYLAAQMNALLTDDLWLHSARSANANLARLAAGLRDVPGMEFHYPPQANIIFGALPRAAHRRLQKAGAMYHLLEGELEGDPDEPLPMRLVCDWSISEDNIDRFIALAHGQ